MNTAKRTLTITHRQHSILTWLRDRLAEGCSPTIREIGRAFSIRSTAAVSETLAALQKKGLLQREALEARGIRSVGSFEGLPVVAGNYRP